MAIFTFDRYLNAQESPFREVYSEEEKENNRLYLVIPCFDEPDVTTPLRSLIQCDRPVGQCSVIFSVNHSVTAPEHSKEQNRRSIREIIQWAQEHPIRPFTIRVLEAADLPAKWAGVGWGRKIGMDEAVRQVVRNGQKDGLLIGLDADSSVSGNYLTTLYDAFHRHGECNFFTLHFEHPLDPDDHFMREGIIRYELHLRYLRAAMEWCGYPHAIHTVGSSFAVRASAYARQGGMNRRQAGEDFHFLHKMVLLGKYGIITSATVYPAARISHRVPFGTGASLSGWGTGDDELYTTYPFATFSHLKPMMNAASLFYEGDPVKISDFLKELHPVVSKFATDTGIADKIGELRKNCSDKSTFERRYFHVVNAFWIIQCLNIFQQSYEQCDQELFTQTRELLKSLDSTDHESTSPSGLLSIFRQRDRNIANCI